MASFKPLVFVLGMYPLMRWVWLGLNDGLGANPLEFLIRSSGVWALVALCLTLSVSPLRRYLQRPVLIRYRRMLGLFAFFYTVLHLLAWAWWEMEGSLPAMLNDFMQRPFIAVGVFAFVPMLALALTSTRGWIRRLGARWQALHSLIYGIALLSVWHFWLVRAGKNDFSEVYVYALVVLVLLLMRTGASRASRAKKPPSARL